MREDLFRSGKPASETHSEQKELRAGSRARQDSSEWSPQRLPGARTAGRTVCSSLHTAQEPEPINRPRVKREFYHVIARVTVERGQPK